MHAFFVCLLGASTLKSLFGCAHVGMWKACTLAILLGVLPMNCFLLSLLQRTSKSFGVPARMASQGHLSATYRLPSSTSFAVSAALPHGARCI